jgi:hypothetical protein
MIYSENKFSHEIIREFFEHRLGAKKTEHYKSYANCLKVLRPSEYFERAQLLLDSGQIKSSLTLFIIGYLKNIRSWNKDK